MMFLHLNELLFQLTGFNECQGTIQWFSRNFLEISPSPPPFTLALVKEDADAGCQQTFTMHSFIVVIQ